MPTTFEIESYTKFFSPADVAYLTNRGIPIEYAAEERVRSVSAAEATKYGHLLKERFPGLPVYPVDALLVRYPETLDGRPRARMRPVQPYYYEGEPGVDERRVDIPRWLSQPLPVVPYIPAAISSALKDPSATLHIVESPIKALSLAANGMPAIGLGGVEAGFHDVAELRKGHLSINRELARVNWRGRPVVVVYDAGIHDNPKVAHGSAKLAAVLADAGARVSIAHLPLYIPREATDAQAVVWTGEDQGPDDLIGREGPDALRAVIARAVPAEPVARAEALLAGTPKEAWLGLLTSLLADLSFVAGLHVGGALAVDRIGTVFAKAKIGKRAIREAVDGFVARLSERTDEATQLDLPYAVESGRMAIVGDGEPRYLAEFTARIVDDITRDDGAQTSHVYRIEGALASGPELPAIEVPAEKFGSLEWVSDWGARAIVRAGRDTKDHLRTAIQAVSSPASRTVFTHIGWRKLDDHCWSYLHPGGAIGSTSAVTVDVDLGPFALPDAVVEPVEAIKESLAVLDCGDWTTTVPLLGATFLAPLASTLEPDFALWVVGLSGSGKSTLSALAQAHWGRFDFNRLPVSWFSTSNAIEAALHRWKDAVVVVDNYVPSEGRDQQELSTKALRLIQTIGDRASRGRLDRDLRERARRDPRGLVIATGEDLPPANESTLGRLIVVDAEKGKMDLSAVRGLDRSKLPHAMRAYLEMIAEDYGGSAKLARGYLDQSLDLLLPRLPGSHERTARNLSMLSAGLSMLLRLCVRYAVLSEDQLKDYKRHFCAALLDVGRRQRTNAESARPTDRYVGAIRSLLLQGRVALAPLGQSLDVYTSPGTRAIGWIEGDGTVFLVPSLAWEAVEQFVGSAKWPFKQIQMHKALLQAGAINAGESAEHPFTRRVSTGQGRQWVLTFPPSIFPTEGTPKAVDDHVDEQLSRDFGPH